MFRPIAVCCALVLLAACASEAPAPTPVKPATVTKPAAAVAPLPANLRELTGNLTNVPAGASVELALLVIDDRARPLQLLGNITLQGNGQVLPFHLPFNPDSFPANARVELHGRVSQSAQLILRLDPLRITSATTQALGDLRFDAAP